MFSLFFNDKMIDVVKINRIAVLIFVYVGVGLKIRRNLNMFKLYIGLDEERMERDGLDVEEAWNKIDEMVIETDDIDILDRGNYETESVGSRSFLMMNLRDEAWFMKYVNKLVIEDPTRIEDVIREYQKLGIRCCYE